MRREVNLSSQSSGSSSVYRIMDDRWKDSRLSVRKAKTWARQGKQQVHVLCEVVYRKNPYLSLRVVQEEEYDTVGEGLVEEFVPLSP